MRALRIEGFGLFVSGTWTQDTHTPDDTPETLNFTRVAEVTNVTAAACYVLSRYRLEEACEKLGVLEGESRVGVGHFFVVLFGAVAVLIVAFLLWRVAPRSADSSSRSRPTPVSRLMGSNDLRR